MKTIYAIPAPSTINSTIEIYGDPDNAWYEYRILQDGHVLTDTGTERGFGFQGRQYGQAEIALRDALMTASGLPEPYAS